MHVADVVCSASRATTSVSRGETVNLEPSRDLDAVSTETAREATKKFSARFRRAARPTSTRAHWTVGTAHVGERSFKPALKRRHNCRTFQQNHRTQLQRAQLQRSEAPRSCLHQSQPTEPAPPLWAVCPSAASHWAKVNS